MNVLRHLLGTAAVAAATMLPTVSFAAVPPVDSVGRAGSVVCRGTSTTQIPAVHLDKIIFLVTGTLPAANPVDQPALSKIPLNTELDIKVLDDPKTVADLKGKVLTFLGAIDNANTRTLITIKDVEYAVVCPSVKQPTTGTP